jgi:hypothetical protein
MRGRRVIAAALIGLLVAASVSSTRGYTLEIVDADGRPAVAYALFNHQGHWLNPAHPVSYDATPRTIIRSDAGGHLRVPSALHLHYPFPVQTHPTLWIEMVYVPRLHNAEGRFSKNYAASMAGVWEMDAASRRAVVFDLSDRPERWQATLSHLAFFIRPLVFPPGQLDAPTARMLIELIGHFRGEYEAFLARHGDALRPRPPMPVMFSEDEKRRWAEMVDADLAARPTWGLEIRRLYEGEVASLTQAAADLKPIVN